MSKSRIVACILLLLVAWSCQKRKDLVSKAFADKDFDKQIEEVNQAPEEVPEEPETKEESTKVNVLVDRLQEHPEDSVYNKTGKPDRINPPIFENDPEAPILNFEDEKLYDIIHLLCDELKVNYIIDPAVKDQTVTISMVRSDNKLKTSDLFELLLKLHDLTIVNHGSFINIVPISSPEVNPGLDILHGSRPNKNLRREELIMQIIPLKYVKPSDMAAIVKEFLSPSARIYEEPKNNVLIIVDKNHFISKVMELIPIFDIDVLQNKRMVFYQLAHVDAMETMEKLNEILDVYGYTADDKRVTMVPIDTLNGILVVASNASLFSELDFWIHKFDKEASFEEEQVFVYKVENSTAANISYTLTQIFDLRTSGSSASRVNRGASDRRTTNPNRNSQDPNLAQNDPNQAQSLNQQNNVPPQRGQSRQPGQQQGNTNGEGPMMIVDDDNNSLIFMTTQREYSRIFKTLKKLDILPRQVFLEVTVLSVDLKDSFKFGLEWGGDNETNTTEELGHGFSGTAGGGGISGTYTYTAATAALNLKLSAAKTQGYSNVLQQPHIMAIDNMAASIAVGTDVPIQTTTTNLGSIVGGTSTSPASQSNIQYRPTGVTLSFTPHINANGVIRLEITLDISSAGAQASTAEAVPISQNSLTTEMIIRDGQTAVMGGLIFDSEDWARNGTPLLSKIPLLRHLFTTRTSSNTKSELVVMITPRLIDTEEKSIAISKEFRDKIFKEFESFKTDK